MSDDYLSVLEKVFTEKSDICAQSRDAYKQFDQDPDSFKTSNGLYRCYSAFCAMQYETWYDMLSHWFSQHPGAYTNDADKLVCPNCEKTFKTQGSFENHCLSHFGRSLHNQSVTKTKKQTIDRTDGFFSCPLSCGSYFEEADLLFRHIKKMHSIKRKISKGQRHECLCNTGNGTLCHKWISTNSFVRHVKLMHYHVSGDESKYSNKKQKQS